MDNPQSNIPSEIRNYLEGLLEDANMTTLDDNMREEMIKELYARLDVFITTAIVENMPPEHMETFIKMNEEKKSKEEVEEFLKEKMPNAQEVFAKAFVDFRSHYLGSTTVAKNAPRTDQ